VDFDSTIPRFESWRPSQPYPLFSECRWPEIRPTFPGPDLPPFLIQHGSDDDLVPVGQSMLLARALREVMPETDVRFDVVPGSLHGGPAFEAAENMARVFAFLSAALAPFGKPALDQGELSP
jgi:acetyl esterase/lipase